MSYEIDYSQLIGKEKQDKAIKDCRSWLNDNERWDRLIAVLSAAIHDEAPFHALEFLCSFAGIQGYPVEALTRYICELTHHELPKGLEQTEETTK